MEDRTQRSWDAPAEFAGTGTCEHCGRGFERPVGVGRPRRYCRRSCRQRAYERRRHDGDQAWGDRRIIELGRQLAAHEDAIDRVRWLADQLDRDAREERPCDAGELARRLDEALRLEEP